LQVFSSQPGIWPELSLASPNPGIRGEAIRQMKENIQLGQGTTDFGPISNKLLEIGYTRPCILEIVIPGGTDEDFRVSKTALEELGWQT